MNTVLQLTNSTAECCSPLMCFNHAGTSIYSGQAKRRQPTLPGEAQRRWLARAEPIHPSRLIRLPHRAFQITGTAVGQRLISIMKMIVQHSMQLGRLTPIRLAMLPARRMRPMNSGVNPSWLVSK